VIAERERENTVITERIRHLLESDLPCLENILGLDVYRPKPRREMKARVVKM